MRTPDCQLTECGTPALPSARASAGQVCMAGFWQQFGMGIAIVALSFSINWFSLAFTTKMCAVLTVHTAAAFGTFGIACCLHAD